MIDMRQLGEQLARQDDHLRQTHDGLIAGGAPDAVLQIVAEGLGGKTRSLGTPRERRAFHRSDAATEQLRLRTR